MEREGPQQARQGAPAEAAAAADEQVTPEPGARDVPGQRRAVVVWSKPEARAAPPGRTTPVQGRAVPNGEAIAELLKAAAGA
jgi:hypothetical protein